MKTPLAYEEDPAKAGAPTSAPAHGAGNVVGGGGGVPPVVTETLSNVEVLTWAALCAVTNKPISALLPRLTVVDPTGVQVCPSAEV